MFVHLFEADHEAKYYYSNQLHSYSFPRIRDNFWLLKDQCLTRVSAYHPDRSEGRSHE